MARGIRVRAALVAVLVTCVVVACGACGGGTAAIDGAGTPGTSSDGSADGPSIGDASASDGATGADVGGDATGDGGASTRRVSCGATECTRDGDGKSRQLCCVVPGSPPQMSCVAELQSDACMNGGARACDDRADCAANEVCCAEVNAPGTLSTRCMPSCITGAPRWQVCKSQADCDTGFPCTTNACPKQGPIGFCGAAVAPGCF